MTLTELESQGLGPQDVTKAEWVQIMRAHMRALGQPEECGTLHAPYVDYEEYWERNQYPKHLDEENNHDQVPYIAI